MVVTSLGGVSRGIEFSTRSAVFAVFSIRGSVDPGSGPRAQMQNKLSAVCVREEVLAKPWHQKECSSAQAQKCGHEHESPVDQCGQHQLIRDAQAFKSSLKAALKP